jgi:asparagine synthase (glutamine-hydrolysing)
MCGIFFYKNGDPITQELEELLVNYLNRIQHRGPDDTSYVISDDQFIGFHRLAINGLSEKGDQPFEYDRDDGAKDYIICNGEIYNWRELNERYELGLEEDDSDCAVIYPLYKKIGLKKMIDMLDGVFAFIIVDGENICAGRDPIGVRPLFWSLEDGRIGFCSEAKGLSDKMRMRPFPPGSYWKSSWVNSTPKSFFKIEEWKDVSPNPFLSIMKESEMKKAIADTFIRAVKKRMLSDRPIGCLLSGGLDSSLVAAILQREMKDKKLNTYSIGFKGSPDLEAARKVAYHIGSNHHEVILKWKEIEEKLPEIIMKLETYDTTTIRASIGMYFVSKYIREKTDDVVIFSGEGADELAQGYLYFHRQPSDTMGHLESMRLMNNLYMYDVLRADRTTAAHGLEVRVPFLDKQFMKLIVSLPYSKVCPQKKTEKYLIRSAFAKTGLLPDEILWRKKEAFSDGVSSQQKNWLDKIKKMAKLFVSDEDMENVGQLISHCVPRTKEEYFYRKIFDTFYKNAEDFIPEFWMPKWSPETIDPSARTLAIYETPEKENEKEA